MRRVQHMMRRFGLGSHLFEACLLKHSFGRSGQKPKNKKNKKPKVVGSMFLGFGFWIRVLVFCFFVFLVLWFLGSLDSFPNESLVLVFDLFPRLGSFPNESLVSGFGGLARFWGQGA